MGATNAELIDIFFGTKIRWIRKPDSMEVKKTTNDKHTELLATSIEKDVNHGKLWRVPEFFPHVLLPKFFVEQNEPNGEKKIL